ncbi:MULTISPECIES: NADPH-dependent FMN reductase [Chryseobacterium]|uniref:Chromate reductase n=1 Tax=Chryseobacterium camelliae TaxID=1265445 RepID=A0ABU0TE43_9FLAO|nr:MULTISPECIES: NAD(P)H-dependent oxidoreductase [Chryseobacterium]MDT3406940.1 chromate reductase [Pseudacidovorax intermedius]MDQ1095267.1 chromate reductase [Chryseobacterium camelliae]MDQ1099205.1 chromate reductase [Chryseobacterium sp. SORGH_AS_1048]MDR6086555.1 chromate reductase [Chryseobacterium sp. SORGH_AS_0909]MDR6130925.1 chromate reductase [Chryseobacterium sp. SORGH_AS_1175]
MILLFAGSNNPYSINHTVLEWISGLMDTNRTELIKLSDYDFPMYSLIAEKTGFPDSLRRIREQIELASALILAVPEHNGSVPAFFKNMLDWLSRYRPEYRIFSGKKVYILSASPGSGGDSAVRHMKDILARMGAVVEHSLVIPDFYRHIETDGKSNLPDDALRQQLLTFINKI